jgi:hypothetical protein
MTDFLHSWPPPSIRGPIAEDFNLQRKIEYPSLLRVAPVCRFGSWINAQLNAVGQYPNTAPFDVQSPLGHFCPQAQR